MSSASCMNGEGESPGTSPELRAWDARGNEPGVLYLDLLHISSMQHERRRSDARQILADVGLRAKLEIRSGDLGCRARAEVLRGTQGRLPATPIPSIGARPSS